MKALLRIAALLDRVVNAINHYACLLILPLILITVFDVVSRKIPGLQNMIIDSVLGNFLSPTKLQEMEWHLHTCVFLLAFGATYIANGHVRVDLVKEKLAIKSQAIIELLGIVLLALPYLFVMSYFAFEFVASSYAQNEVSPALTGLPYRWIIKSVLLFGVGLLVVAILATLFRILVMLVANESLKQQAYSQLAIFSHQSDSDTPTENISP